MGQLFFIVETIFCEVGTRLLIIYIILKLQVVKDRNCIGYAHSKTSINLSNLKWCIGAPAVTTHLHSFSTDPDFRQMEFQLSLFQ
jgi:hypothetical protein